MFQGMWLISLHFDVSTLTTPLPCFIMYNHFSESGGGVCSHMHGNIVFVNWRSIRWGKTLFETLQALVVGV